MKSLLWLLRSAFGCHHSRMSRVFTIKNRTYQVCFECGQEREYSQAAMHRVNRSGSAGTVEQAKSAT
jgi:hypothetical protein